MYNSGLFSKYRTELMGIAALFIILCHMPAHDVSMPKTIARIISHGGAGCDMFLFCSGLGLYKSLSIQKTSGSILSWYTRRFSRVLVPYLMICIPVFIYYAMMGNWDITTLLLRLSTLSYWTEGWGLWYIALTLFLYLFSPLIDKINSLKYRIYWMTLLILLSWSFSFFPEQLGIMGHIQFVMCRVPSFLLGYMNAKFIIEEKEFNLKWTIIILVTIYVFCFIVAKFMGFHLSLSWIEGMILILLSLWLLHQYTKPCIMNAFQFFGNISLESYCTNVFVLLIFRNIPWSIKGINLNPGNWTYYIVGTFCLVVISVFVHRISQNLLKAFLI